MDIKELEKLGFTTKLTESRKDSNSEETLSISKRGRLTIPSYVFQNPKKVFSGFTPLFNEKQCELALLFHTEESNENVAGSRPLAFYTSKNGKSTTAYAELAHILRKFLHIKKIGAMRVTFRTDRDVLILKLSDYKKHFSSE